MSKVTPKSRAVKVRGMYLQNPSDEHLLTALDCNYVIAEIKGVLHYDIFMGIRPKSTRLVPRVFELSTAGAWNILPDDFESFTEVTDLTKCSMLDPFNN